MEDVAEGCGRAVVVEGREIALFRLHGEFYAIDNMCPHRGGSLGHGALEGEEVVCPIHGWRFNIKTGRQAMTSGVESHPVRVDGNEIMVGFD
jgi:nitrite reductase/ring-hydroxylating ferredoxin subunit